MKFDLMSLVPSLTPDEREKLKGRAAELEKELKRQLHAYAQRLVYMAGHEFSAVIDYDDPHLMATLLSKAKLYYMRLTIDYRERPPTLETARLVRHPLELIFPLEGSGKREVRFWLLPPENEDGEKSGAAIRAILEKNNLRFPKIEELFLALASFPELGIPRDKSYSTISMPIDDMAYMGAKINDTSGARCLYIGRDYGAGDSKSLMLCVRV